MFRPVILLITLFFSISVSRAQELNCQVEVSSIQVQGTDKRVFETLQLAIFEFMNNTRWTTDVFMINERIECSILINVTGRVSTDEFTATISVQSRRPVYKSSYNTSLFNHTDTEFSFRYLEFQPLEFSPVTHISNLTSVLAYYAYLVIGLDYDSFSPLGGTPYFQKALAVVNNAQNATETGWKAFENDRNRYWIVENLLSQTFAPLRDVHYTYHIKGLDVMISDMDAARAQILTSLESLKTIHRIKPMSFNIQIFFNAKTDELVSIFSQALPAEKAKAVQLLSELNPGHTARYQRIMAGN